MSTVQSIAAADAASDFDGLLGRVEDGAEFTITRHGAPVAKIIPIRSKSTPEERAAAIEAWRKTSAGLTLGGLEIKDLITEGRR